MMTKRMLDDTWPEYDADEAFALDSDETYTQWIAKRDAEARQLLDEVDLDAVARVRAELHELPPHLQEWLRAHGGDGGEW